MTEDLSRVPVSMLRATLAQRQPDPTEPAFTFPFQPHQQIPDTDWLVCLFQAGRGAGKTWTGAAWAALQAEVNQPNEDGVLVGPTFKAVREVMVENRRSGILAMLGDRVVNYNRSTFEITTSSGSRIYMRSAEEPDSIRGLSLGWGWADEVASWTRDTEAWHEGLGFALREAERPQRFVTTTPKPTTVLRELHKRIEENDPAVAVMRASTMDNTHLPEAAVTEMRRQYDGKRLGRQELYGELLEDVEGALWRSEWIIVDEPPTEFTQVVVGVDPSGGRDEVGIVAAGITAGHRIWVLADRSARFDTTGDWAATAVNLADELGADRIIAERNFGGDMVRDALQNFTGRKRWLVEMVTASRGKRTRAEPVAVLYEPGVDQPTGGTVRHAAHFPSLVDQMLTWVPGQGKSPDRVDALVWAVSWLMDSPGDAWSELDDILGPGGMGQVPW